MSTTPRIAIIGTGPTGLFSIFTCGMLGFRSYVFDRQEQIGGQCVLYPDKPIYDIPGFPCITAKELVSNLEKQSSPFRPEYHLGSQVLDVKKLENNEWQIITNKNNALTVKAIIIAGGVGAFGPRKPPISNINDFENKSVFYHIPDKTIFTDKVVVIAGGGDSAADWAIELAKIAKKVFVIHRRKQFRCHPSSEECIQDLVAKKDIDLLVPCQLKELIGDNGKLKKIIIEDIISQATTEIECDYLLPFFGLSADLGPIMKWDLEVKKNVIPVHPETMQTQQEGIYAIGDIASYPGKLKLIMNGFAEAATAAHAIRSYLNPNEFFHFKYSTVQGIKPL